MSLDCNKKGAGWQNGAEFGFAPVRSVDRAQSGDAARRK